MRDNLDSRSVSQVRNPGSDGVSTRPVLVSDEPLCHAERYLATLIRRACWHSNDRSKVGQVPGKVAADTASADQDRHAQRAVGLAVREPPRR